MAWCLTSRGGAMVLAWACLLPPWAAAQRPAHRLPPLMPPAWHGDISRFHEHDWGVWRGGHWAHARHDGRAGWWWVVGPTWYWYPEPVYPYPNPWSPPPAVVEVPPVPPTAYWYFCESAGAYYPYVATCPTGWKQVPATPADTAPPAQ